MIHSPAIIFDNKFIIFNFLIFVAVSFTEYNPLYIVDCFPRLQVEEY